MIGFADLAHDRIIGEPGSTTRWIVDLGEAGPAELVRRAAATGAGVANADVLLVATVSEDPRELVAAADDLAFRGLVLRVAPELLSGPVPWVAGTLEYGRRHCPQLVLDITSTAAPRLAVDDRPGERQFGEAPEQGTEAAVLGR